MMLKDKIAIEIVIVFTACLVTFLLASEYDILESIVDYSASHEDWEVDELITTFITLALGLSIFTFRRWQELKIANLAILLLSEQDALTGLYNRHKLTQIIEMEIERSVRYQRPFSVILLDIDYFKLVNDTWGHNVGDEVLVAFSTIIKDTIRAADKVGRWGGEEFLILCPESRQEDAEVLAHKLRASINAHRFKTVGLKTASFGVAGYMGGSQEDLFHEADLALYQAKSEGRDQVVTVSSLKQEEKGTNR
jgi:diguanylate cyclase (GGDEF)-like protein